MAQAGLGLLRLAWCRPWTGWMTARAGSIERGWRGPRPRRAGYLRRTKAADRHAGFATRHRRQQEATATQPPLTRPNPMWAAVDHGGHPARPSNRRGFGPDQN